MGNRMKSQHFKMIMQMTAVIHLCWEEVLIGKNKTRNNFKKIDGLYILGKRRKENKIFWVFHKCFFLISAIAKDTGKRTRAQFPLGFGMWIPSFQSSKQKL